MSLRRLPPGWGRRRRRICNKFTALKSVAFFCFAVFCFGMILQFEAKMKTRTYEAMPDETTQADTMAKEYLKTHKYYDLNSEMLTMWNGESLHNVHGTCSEVCLARETSPVVVIGMLSCDGIEEQRSARRATTTIKAVLISAEMYFVSHVDFHIFIYADTSDYIMSKLKEFGYIMTKRRHRVHVKVHFHPIFQAIPEWFQKDGKFIINHENLRGRSQFAQFFYARNLPKVDSIIHLDTNIIITGDISSLWSYFGRMREGQIIAIAPASEPDPRFVYQKLQLYKLQVPVVKPWGLSTGVLAMNLTRMRRGSWERKVLEVYSVFSDSIHFRNDAGSIMNFLLADNRGLMKLLPCQYNFELTDCDNGMKCKAAVVDPIGIQAIHGTDCQFTHEEQTFYKVFHAYEKYDMANEDIRKSLMIPLRQYYSKQSEGRKSACFGSINKLLYKKFFP